MMTLEPLQTLFQESDYAWQLLQNEISIQLSLQPDGKQIAKLLQLYMRGVQKMNSKMDPRQSYFKNKVSTLMSKQTVIRSLNNKSMKKKSLPFQATQLTIPDKQTIKKVGLIQKKKQLQMRMAYGVEENNVNNLRKMLEKQTDRQINLTNKIEKIYNNHEEKLMQRIRHRKLKTATARSISSNFETFGNMQNYERKKITKKFQEIIQEIKQPTRSSLKRIMEDEKRSKSVENPKIPELFNDMDSPTRKTRRMTEDLNRTFS